jgi:phosphoglycolate phosphatase
MTQIYTILFDLDGAIVHTAPDLMSAHNHVMKKFGHPTKELSDIKSLAGKGAWMMMQRSFKREVTDEKIKKEMTTITVKILQKIVSHLKVCLNF